MVRNPIVMGGHLACLLACAAVGIGWPVPKAEAQTPPQVPSVGPAVPDRKTEVPFLGGFLRETRIVYPLQLGEWKAVDEHLYGQQELGVSVRYMHGTDRDKWIDLYFYPAGVISAEQFGKIADMEREGLRQAHLQRGMAVPDIPALRRFSFEVPSGEGKSETKSGFYTDFEYAAGGEKKNSAMTLMFEQMYLIKGRFSAAATTLSREQATDMLETLMAQLLRRLRINSTGECWMPLPIETLKDGEAPPANRIKATFGKDGEAKVYLLDDRVLAADPKGGPALIMMMLGMSQRGRLFDGCIDTGAEIPPVPADMREIHLEYRVPPDDSTPADAPPLRSHRAGVS